MSGLTLEDSAGNMTEAIVSIRDAGGWKAVMETMGQDHGELFRQLVGAVAQVPGEEPTMFEFWLCGFLAGLYNAHQERPIGVHIIPTDGGPEIRLAYPDELA